MDSGWLIPQFFCSYATYCLKFSPTTRNEEKFFLHYRHYDDKAAEAGQGFWNCPCVPMRERYVYILHFNWKFFIALSFILFSLCSTCGCLFNGQYQTINVLMILFCYYINVFCFLEKKKMI